MSLSKWLPCDFEQCHPLLWGGGILVDHWSTISSLSFARTGTLLYLHHFHQLALWCHDMEVNLHNSLRPSDAYIYVSKLTIIGSDNGLSPGQRQAIIWTNAGILLTGSLVTHFNETLTQFIYFHSRKSFWKCRLENSASMSQPQCVNWPFVRGTVDRWWIPYKGLVTWSFDVSFVVGENKLLNKQHNWQWFETPWCSCECNCDVLNGNCDWHPFFSRWFCHGGHDDRVSWSGNGWCFVGLLMRQILSLSMCITRMTFNWIKWSWRS